MIDVSFHAHDAIPTESLIDHLKTSYGYTKYLKKHINVQVILLAHSGGEIEINGVPFIFFKGTNKKWFIPLKTLRYIKQRQADVIMLEGLGFPIHVIMLRLVLGKKSIIACQHHGERPPSGVKVIFQKWADRLIDAYLFTAMGNASIWLRKVIESETKCYELQELSTYFSRQDKAACRKILGLGEENIFIWIGRLNDNKDPLTILNGFERHIRENGPAKLYMVYQEDDLLSEVKQKIRNNEGLMANVNLVGKVERDNLAVWLSAADFYISGSHREGSGTALIEAMACGCIPVVTDIPPFRKITGDGEYGLLFSAGDADTLFDALKAAENIDKEKLSNAVAVYFVTKLSFKAIADNLTEICEKIIEGRWTKKH